MAKGHNGGPGSAPVKMYYFQAEIVNFRDGIRTLKADQRGVYLSVLLEIYDCMGPILFDPKRLSLATGLDARLIARVVPELVALGKLYLADGWIHNSRAEKEIGDYVKNHAKLSDIAKEREAAKKERRTIEQPTIEDLRKQLEIALAELRQTSASGPPQTKPDVSGTSALALGDVSKALGETSKKHNNINDEKADDCQRHTTTRAREESRIQNLESKNVEKEKNLLSELHSDDADPRPGKKRADYTEDFNSFWRQYPDTQNNSKARAFDEWRRLTADDRSLAFASLPAFARFLLDRKAEGKPHPVVHAERYLKHRRFEGYAPGTASLKNDDPPWWKDPAKVAQITDAQWRNTIANHANGIWPPSKLGPAPGNKRCVVPQHIIDELRLTEKYTPDGVSKIRH